MLYMTITKVNFKLMVEGLIEDNEVFGPKWRDRDAQGNKIYRFLKLNNFEELQMDYTRTYVSPKNFFLPYKEDLATFQLNNKSRISFSLGARTVTTFRS